MLSTRDEMANIKILIAIFNAAEMFQPLRPHAFSLHILRGGGLTPSSYMFLWCHVPSSKSIKILFSDNFQYSQLTRRCILFCSGGVLAIFL